MYKNHFKKKFRIAILNLIFGHWKRSTSHFFEQKIIHNFKTTDFREKLLHSFVFKIDQLKWKYFVQFPAGNIQMICLRIVVWVEENKINNHKHFSSGSATTVLINKNSEIYPKNQLNSPPNKKLFWFSCRGSVKSLSA